MPKLETVPVKDFATAAGMSSSRTILPVKGRKSRLTLVKKDGKTHVVLDTRARRFLSDRALTEDKTTPATHRVPARLIFRPRRALAQRYRTLYGGVAARNMTIGALEKFFCCDNQTLTEEAIPHLEKVVTWRGHMLFTAASAEKFASEWVKKRSCKIADK